MEETFIGFIAVAGVFSVAIIAIIAGTMKSVAHRKQIEMSRREIAAYIAEGTMSPADGRALMETDPDREA